jgi:hypothetical protein
VPKAGLVELLEDNRAAIYGARVELAASFAGEAGAH